jgi:hypothetical protein
MQRYKIFFITGNALHILGGFCASHLELKNCTHTLHSPTIAVAVRKLDIQACIPDAVCTVFELLMMGIETA